MIDRFDVIKVATYSPLNAEGDSPIVRPERTP